VLQDKSSPVAALINELVLFVIKGGRLLFNGEMTTPGDRPPTER
jgi:hypothetical protein